MWGVTADGKYWVGLNPTNKIVRLAENRFAENIVGSLTPYQYEHKDVVDLVASGDENTIATVSAGVLRRWEAGKESEKPTWETKLDTLEPNGLAVGPGGKLIAVAGKKGEVQVFSAKTGKATTKISDPSGSVKAIGFGTDCKQLATGGEDRTVRIWDVETGKEIASLKGHAGAVTGIAFSSTGEMIATASEDKTVKLWSFKK
jgi:WD40 repeat protein